MSNTRAVIEVAGQKFEMVTQEDGTLIAKPLTDDSLFELSIFEDGFKEALKNDINHLTNKAYDELCNAFKNDIKGTVLKTLGFSDRTYGKGGWEIDHCNGRMSAVTEHLTFKVKELFKAGIDEVIEELMPTIQKEARAAIKTELKDAYTRAAREAAKNAAYEEAKTYVTSLIKKEFEKLKPEAHAQVTATFAKRGPLKP